MLSEESKNSIVMRSIDLYTGTVGFYEAILCEEFDVEQANYLMNKGYPRVGTSKLLSPYYYSFHGAGCAILSGDPGKLEDDKTIVDWDYHEQGLECFRQGFFKYFVSENYPALFAELGGASGLDEIIEQAIRSGHLVSKGGEGDHRFLSIMS